jgi:hypothetical protein
MARIGFDDSERSNSIFDADRFNLKTGHSARVLLLSEDFEVEHVHWVDDEDNKGYYICQGDYNTVRTEGSDPQHCKLCAAAEKTQAVGKARRKFATLLVVYRTNSKGEHLTPISVEVQPWVFADQKYNDLLSKKKQWNDLKKHDLGIKCISEGFQNFTIDVLPEALWLSDEKTKQLVAASYKEARGMWNKDLRSLLGRELDAEKLDDLISNVVGTGNVPDYASPGEVSNMFSDVQVGSPPVADTDFASLLEDTAPAELSFEATDEVPQSSGDVLSASGNNGADSVDFEDLLNS